MDTDQDLYLLNGGYGDDQNAFDAHIFDEFTTASPIVPGNDSMNYDSSGLNKVDPPSDSAVKVESSFSSPQFQEQYRSGSASSSSCGSSSGSRKYPNVSRNDSIDSNNTEALANKQRTNWSSGVAGVALSSGDNTLGDCGMTSLDQGYSLHPDFEFNTRPVTSTFDFSSQGRNSNGFNQGVNKNDVSGNPFVSL
ncbi:MAG: hypothetical protein Q9227_008738 [Pyrenula ochraceoflavens]